jgi:hypothetical protein
MGMQPIAAILIREISDSSLRGARAGDPVTIEPEVRVTTPPKSRRCGRTGLALRGLLASRG